MTDITAKPFDWNDNLSKEAIEDFEGIQKDLPYCTCQNIGMALAKLELLEKQGCKVIDPSGSSSENPNKSEIMTGWIPVSERLPEIHQDVLLSFRSLDVEVGFRGKTEPYYYCHGGYIEPQNVLAWQPLPEPYKAEGGE